MSLNLVKAPDFHCDQRVSFVGGEGVVRSHRFEAESWLYLVEMSLGPEPQFGRVGSETMLVLSEADLREA
jgi:hypothetical protein